MNSSSLKMKIKYSLWCLTILFLFLSCQKDQPDSQERVFPGVERALWPYFKSFEEEALSRGLSIDLVEFGITGSIDNIPEDHVIGRCQYGRFVDNHITIDQPFWNGNSHLSREMVVYHELGHCYLGRGHREDAFRTGLCESIMRSGTCCCRDAYNTSNRSYYLDELFELD